MKAKHRVLVDDDYLKVLQQHSLSQFTVSRLLYQTPWFFWSSNVLLVAPVVFLIAFKYWLAALVFAVFPLMSLSVRYGRRNSLRKARERSQSNGEIVEFTLDEHGFDVIAPNRNAHVEWPGILRAILYRDGVLLEQSPRSYSWLPDKSLTEGSPAELRQLLTDRLVKRVSTAGL